MSARRPNPPTPGSPAADARPTARGSGRASFARGGRSSLALGRPSLLAATLTLAAGALLVLGGAPPAAGDAGSAPHFNPAPPPPEATTATIRPSFSPDKLGAKAAFTFAVHFGGGELGVPSPVRSAVVHLPAGLTLDVPKLRSCKKAQLLARGARGCPARSLIGTGRAVADVHVGSSVESEQAAITAFVGPPQGVNPTIEILGQGYSPLEERVVITATALPDTPPYGEKLVMRVPAIPTIPLEPNASEISFSLTVGGRSAQRHHNPNTVLLPSRCPTGGFPFAAQFTYEDGSTSDSTATVPCP
jgi:hypothetical protein